MFQILWGFFLTCAGIQLIINFSAMLGFIFYKNRNSSGNSKKGVSLIICAKNEYKNLKRLLTMLLQQDYSEYEIIVVDDRSTDETYDFMLEESKKEEKIKLVRIESTPDHINNKKYAITLGVKAAKYDIVLLTDADCYPQSKKWINEMMSGFHKKEIDFVIGYSQYEMHKGFLSTFINYETLLTALHYIGLGLLYRPYMGVGRNLAYRKSVFLNNNGFGRFRSIVGGDDDLFVNEHAKRKNTRFVFTKNTLIHSVPKKHLSEFLLQKKRHLSVGKYYRFFDKLLLFILTLSKIGLYAAFLTAILAGFQTYFVLGGFILIMVSLLGALYALKYKTGDKSGIWLLPILDFIYIFYYISTGLKAFFVKKVRWK